MIVITDNATGNRVHRSDCIWVDEEHFARKVLENGGRNGRYYAVASVEEARRLFASSPCGVCTPS